MMIEVKICENCNHKNPVNAVECEKCGYDLTFVYPQRVEDDSELNMNENPQKGGRETCIMNQTGILTEWELICCADNSRRQPITEEMSVGRDCDVFNEQFNTSNYTSRTHAKLRIYDGVVQVMDASTNGTFIDDVRIPKMEWTLVPEGSTIRFADLSFVVRRINNSD